MAGAPMNAAVIASTKLNMKAIRISTCETPMRISSSSVPRSRASSDQASRRRARRGRPTATARMTRTQTTRRRTSSATVRRAMTITRGAPASSASSSRKRASSEPRPGSTAWTRPPAATTAATRSGIRSAASGRIVSHSPSTATGPNAARADRPASSRPVTRTRTPSAATTSSSGPRGDRPAVVEDHDPVAHPLDLGQQVRVEDHRRAAVARGADDRPDVHPPDRVERRGRLVEQDQLRVAEQGDAEPEPLLHPLGEAADRRRRPGRPGRHGRAPRPRRPVGGPAPGSGPARRGGRGPRARGATAGSGTARAGSRSARGRPGRRAGRPGRCPEPRVGRASPRSELDGRRLAGAVRPEQADQLAAADDAGRARRAPSSGRTS